MYSRASPVELRIHSLDPAQLSSVGSHGARCGTDKGLPPTHEEVARKEGILHVHIRAAPCAWSPLLLEPLAHLTPLCHPPPIDALQLI